MVSVVSTDEKRHHIALCLFALCSMLLVLPPVKKFETFFYIPSVAVQMENESLRNVVILQYENDECLTLNDE